MSTQNEFPYECCQCGFCCILERCPICIALYGDSTQACPALELDDNIAVCNLATSEKAREMLGIGKGCCAKATVIRAGRAIDFSSLSTEEKFYIVRNINKIPTFKRMKERR